MLYTTQKSTKRAARTLQAALVLAASFAATDVMAGVIVEYMLPGDATLEAQVGSAMAFGQSVTTPTGGPWSNIKFNFYVDTALTTPSAAGNLYVYTQEYVGDKTLAGTGNPANPGYLGVSTGIESGVWTFGDTLTLATDTQYWFYATSPITGGSFTTALEASGSNYIDGNIYLPIDGSWEDYDDSDANFTLQGDPAGATVPEPASLTLCGAIGLAGLAFARRRRKAAQPEA
jgi:hypothetical protein